MTEKDSKEHSQKTYSPNLQESKATITKDGESNSSSKTSRVVGPIEPGSYPDNEQPQEISDDSSDDDFGPQLPPAVPRESSQSKDEQELRLLPSIQDVVAESKTTKKRQRDDWMLNPPENTSWASGMNPAALTNRKFMTGKSTRGSQPSEGISSVWTENPDQKRQRLENEILGINSESSTRSTRPGSLSSKKNLVTADKVKSLSSNNSKSSLYETHQKGNHTAEDDPSSRAFDWNKDVAGKTNISGSARKKMLNQASDYTSRFSGGKYI